MFQTTRQVINGFRIDFTYLLTNFNGAYPAEGIAFVVQNTGPTALGGAGN